MKPGASYKTKMGKQILIHGLGQGPESWSAVLSALLPAEERCCLNLPELLDGQCSYENLYGAIKRMCRAMGEEVQICGLSLGAVLALNLAAECKREVASVILIAPQYKMPETLLKIQDAAFRLMPERCFESTGFGKKGMLALTRSMRGLNLEGAVKSISCQTLIICGEKDGANKKAARELAGLIQGAELRTVENAGHELNTDAPEELARLMNEFWNGKR